MIILIFLFLNGWSGDFLLDQNPNSNQYLPHSFQNSICENDFHIIISGYENPNWLKSRNFIYFKPFNGVWSPKKIPYDGEDFDEHPVILSDKNNFLYIFYQRLKKYEPYSIYYQVSESPANYESFTYPKKIDFGSQKWSELSLNFVFDNDGKINLLFSSDSGNSFNIYHAKRINPFYFEIKKISNGGDNIFPQIIKVKDTIYIFYLKFFSSNSFITLNKLKDVFKENILYSLGDDIKYFFSLPYFNSKIFIFYTNNESLFFAIYDILTGKIIENREILKYKDIYEINGCCDSLGFVHVFFTAGCGEESDIFYIYSYGGTNFSELEKLTFTPFSSYSPHSFYSKKEGKIYLFWTDERDKGLNLPFYSKIYYKFKDVGKLENLAFKPNILKIKRIREVYKNGIFFDINGRRILKDFKNGIIFIQENNERIKLIGL